MTDTWWIPPQKQYQPETTKWYCHYCEKITLLERNLDWDGIYEGERPAPPWFVRCGVCKEKHWQADSFNCPNCGWCEADEDSLIVCGESIYCAWKAMEFGGHPIDWDETHKCPMCGTVFTFTNSNC